MIKVTAGEQSLVVLRGTSQESYACNPRCNPTIAQFIVDLEFGEPVVVDGAFDKRLLDPAYVRERETLVTRGWRRLREVLNTEAAIINYPLPEVREAIRRKAGY